MRGFRSSNISPRVSIFPDNNRPVRGRPRKSRQEFGYLSAQKFLTAYFIQTYRILAVWSPAANIPVNELVVSLISRPSVMSSLSAIAKVISHRETRRGHDDLPQEGCPPIVLTIDVVTCRHYSYASGARGINKRTVPHTSELNDFFLITIATSGSKSAGRLA